MRKGIAVQTILSVALALMFIIAAALIIHLLFPYASETDCMKGQRLHIEEIESLTLDAKNTGTTYITKFRVESCVECMWYNGTHVVIRWVGMSTTAKPRGVRVSASWQIGDNDGDNSECKEDPIKNLKGDTTCVFEITYNAVNKYQPC